MPAVVAGHCCCCCWRLLFSREPPSTAPAAGTAVVARTGPGHQTRRRTRRLPHHTLVGPAAMTHTSQNSSGADTDYDCRAMGDRGSGANLPAKRGAEKRRQAGSGNLCDVAACADDVYCQRPLCSLVLCPAIILLPVLKCTDERGRSLKHVTFGTH